MNIKEFFFFSFPAILFSLVLYYFIIWNLGISLTNYSLLNTNPRFIGLDNFIILFNDEDFIGGLERTLMWVFVLVFVGNTLGIIIASAIFNIESVRMRNAFVSYFIYPLALSQIASGIIWRWLFDLDRGFDYYLHGINFPIILWLNGSNALWSVILVSIWVYTGLGSLFYLAMFYNVDKSLIESAFIDGASIPRIMIKIVLPNSKQGFIISTVFYTLFALQMFDLPYSILYINPFTNTLVIYTFMKFVALYFAVASASALFIIFLSAIIVIPYAMFGLKKWIVRR